MTDCATCIHGWNPPGDVTKIVKDKGDVLIQYGNNTICMDESKDKNIDFSGGEMCCSKYEPKPTIPEKLMSMINEDCTRRLMEGVREL